MFGFQIYRHSSSLGKVDHFLLFSGQLMSLLSKRPIIPMSLLCKNDDLCG